MVAVWEEQPSGTDGQTKEQVDTHNIWKALRSDNELSQS